MKEVDLSVLEEQKAYYRARASEYDKWFFRQDRYDRGEEATRVWIAEIDEVRERLAQLPIDGRSVLELASGTGLWTELLARRASYVVALDASPEMVDECRSRIGKLAEKVRFEITDLFSWEPTSQYDAVVFCFWISHVPDSLLDAFIAKIFRALKPGGVVFFLDSKKEHESTARDHELPSDGNEIMVRRLDDGSEFSIVKNFWLSAELVTRFSAEGLSIDVEETETYFQYGYGSRT